MSRDGDVAKKRRMCKPSPARRVRLRVAGWSPGASKRAPGGRCCAGRRRGHRVHVGVDARDGLKSPQPMHRGVDGDDRCPAHSNGGCEIQFFGHGTAKKKMRFDISTAIAAEWNLLARNRRRPNPTAASRLAWLADMSSHRPCSFPWEGNKQPKRKVRRHRNR